MTIRIPLSAVFSFLALGLLVTNTRAAEPIDLTAKQAQAHVFKMGKLPAAGQLDHRALLARTFAFSEAEAFELLSARADFNGVFHRRYYQTYLGVPLWGTQVVARSDGGGNINRLDGRVVRGVAADVGPVPSLVKLDPERTLKQKVAEYAARFGTAGQGMTKNEEAGLFVCLDSGASAYLCYVVSFFFDAADGNPTQPIFFVDARTGQTIDTYNMLRHAEGTGPGGNVKIDQYQYGTDYPAFDVTQNGGTCVMDTADVKSVDLDHGTSGSTAFSYPCFNNTHKEINGAYSPLNDAQFFGQVVFDLYSQWYGVPPLPFKLTLRCHYSKDYENAFWDGSMMTFGDGASTFYPLVSLDVVAHEVSHGFTSYNSDLTYSNQSGGINEAFSDMAGEAGEFFMRGANDFLIGYDIIKDPDGALRYMHDPPLDGNSIGHVSDYQSGMDVHYSSGVFNKAFYLIANSSGWDTQKAFDIFVKANQDYWTPSSNFQQGAEGALAAAIDYGYSCAEVRAGFAVVGISLVCTNEPQADFTFATFADNLEASFTDNSTCSGCTLDDWEWDFGDGRSSALQNPTHTYTAAGTYAVTLTVTDTDGQTSAATKSVAVPYLPNYCASQSNNASEEWIVGVAMGGFSHASGSAQYSDHTDQIVPLVYGQTYQATITPEFNGGPWTEYFRIWIDYNRDGDFADTGEEVFSASGTSEVSGNLTVIGGSANLSTRMRVSMKYNVAPSPCETFPYGEVEDYSVTLSADTNEPPTVSITSPADGSQYNVGEVINIEADAFDGDGDVVRVEFFAGAAKVGEDTTSPYGIAWGDAAAGVHSLTANATDNLGASMVSDVVTVTVSSAGCVTLYTTDFESDSGGWAFSPEDSTCTTGDWGVGNPDYVSDGGVVTQLEDDHTPSPGVQAFFTEPNTGGAGTNDVDGGVCTAYSPIIDAGAYGSVVLTLWYYHGQRDAGDDASGDYFNIDLSKDGGATFDHNLVAYGDVTHNAAWTEVSVQVSNPGQLQLRVQASDGSIRGDLVEGGIDDVLVCVPQ